QLFFADAAAMAEAMASPEAQAATADIANFATGGASVLVAEVV
ncbi:MAG: EthD family reductase, partial [Novosphingobium meiothermophilum]